MMPLQHRPAHPGTPFPIYKPRSSKWNDIRVLGSLDSAGAQQALDLIIPAVISGDGGIEPVRQLRTTFRDVIGKRFSRHPVGRFDDGDVIGFVEVGIDLDAETAVDSRLLGHRKTCPIKAVSAVAFGIEGRNCLPRVIERLPEIDRFAVLYTTRLHRLKLTFESWRDLDRYPDVDDVEMLAAKQDLPSPVVSWEVVYESGEWPVPMLLEFESIDRFQIIFPLGRTVEFGMPSERGYAERRRDWMERVRGFAAQALPFPVEPCSSDPRRWLHTPRHHHNAEWDLLIFAERPLDPEEMPRLP